MNAVWTFALCVVLWLVGVGVHKVAENTTLIANTCLADHYKVWPQ